MTVRTVSLRCELVSRMGRQAHEGVPFRALETWVQELRAKIPDSEEASCVVLGTEQLLAQYQHTLSPEEVVAERLEQLEGVRREAQDILGKSGMLTAEEVGRLRALLGA